MSTVSDVIRDALGHLGVVDANEALEAQDMQTGIRALNLMLARWAANGLIESWTPLENPADNLGLPPQMEEAIGFSLAVRLRARYAASSDQDVLAMAQQGITLLWRDRIAPDGSGRTVGSIILRALRLLSTPGSFPDAFTLQGAIDAYNSMLNRWEANGLSLGWAPAVAATDVLPTPPEADQAIAASLSVHLAPEYGVDPPSTVSQMASSGLAALRRDNIVSKPIDWARCRGSYDIRSDDYC